ncbi:TPA: hypothetical protein ACKQE3_002604 [Serratia marcescens]|jgi:hypothetical protein|uniref:Lipoprotein n=2 Tax=Serratia TaxID=613 RepID=A0ABC9IN41_SERMA|nr:MULTISPECIES: hypothetical protein [Serratia]MDI6929923.1 hypothetical protein [Serratia sp. Se-PFBMAAmG]QHI80072.1 hypothetical protein GUC32_21790 [Serratia sp. NGAS9]EMB2736250.1 hypothetical protein [Serratia marcescens]MBH2535791.1 hypothetical protein [Serratia marcescens]MBH2625685.1 hypothetical protein [Serratia marcescens]
MKRVSKLLIAFSVAVALVGCARTAPVDNVHSTVSAGHSEAQVRNAILKAGAQRQWIMNDVGPGVIKARQQNRNHSAEVRITYSATAYSIDYDSSQNLLASQGKIHKNYNRWVRNLDKDIQVSLATNALQ